MLEGRDTDVGRKRYRCWKEEIPMLEGRDTDVERKRYRCWKEEVQAQNHLQNP
jgi:hypothetical protein